MLLHGHKGVARSSSWWRQKTSGLVHIEEVWKSPDYKVPRSKQPAKQAFRSETVDTARTIFEALRWKIKNNVQDSPAKFPKKAVGTVIRP